MSYPIKQNLPSGFQILRWDYTGFKRTECDVEKQKKGEFLLEGGSNCFFSPESPIFQDVGQNVCTDMFFS